MSVTSDSVQVSTDTSLQSVSISQEWSDLAVEDGALVLDGEEYAARYISRTNQVESSRISGINYSPKINSAPKLSIDVPPKTFLETDDFLAGTLEVYVDGSPLFAGEIQTINTSSTEGENYTVEATTPGRKLNRETINRTTNNEIVEDSIARTVDEYNTLDGRYEDMRGGAGETFSNITVIGPDVLTASGSSGTATYSSVGPDASDIDILYVKTYTGDGLDVTVKSGGESWTESLTGYQSAEYGTWVAIDVPSISDQSYDIEFTLYGSTRLYDWVSISDLVLKRDIKPLQVEPVGTGDALYSRSGDELNNTVSSTTDGVVYDSSIAGYRTAQKGSWHVVTSGDLNTTSDSDATDGTAWNGDAANATGVSQSHSVRDTIENWRLYARVKTMTASGLVDGSGDWSVTVDVGGSSASYNLFNYPAKSDGYQWINVAEAGDSSNFPADISSDTTIKLSNDGSDVGVRIGSFYLAHGPSSSKSYSYDFDNLVTSGYLSSPQTYTSGYVVFTSEVAPNNITSSTVDTDLPASPDNVDSWGPSQKIDPNASFTSVPDANSKTDSFGYPGSTHFVRIHLSATGLADNQTPSYGHSDMQVTSFSVTIDTDDLEILNSYNLNGNRLEVLSSLADDTSHVFRWDGNKAVSFKKGSQSTSPTLRKERVDSSRTIDGVYTSVEVIGLNGITSGVVEASNPPSFLDRHVEIKDPDLETEQDVNRKAVSFIENNSSINYSGEIKTLPTVAPLGELVSGSNFNHGQDLAIESVRYGKRRSTITLGFTKRLADEIIGINRTAAKSVEQDTK